jgi:ABC-type sulfate transport system permease component
MSSGTSLLQGSHCGRNPSGNNGGRGKDLLCTMIMTLPLVMPFVQGIRFGMHLVNLQKTQVVCRQEHPCFEGHTMVAIILVMIVVSAATVVTSIKEVG